MQITFEQSIYAPYLKSSREKATNLIEILKRISTDISADNEETLTPYEEWSIHHNREQFRSVFFAELSVLPAFLATGKEGYDVNTLIDEGQKLFPASTLSKCPEAESDMREAGKALAFELATSCGFHVFRLLNLCSSVTGTTYLVATIGLNFRLLALTRKNSKSEI